MEDVERGRCGEEEMRRRGDEEMRREEDVSPTPTTYAKASVPEGRRNPGERNL